MSHFVLKVILSAWPWQIYPFAPCSFSLHSLLMTNVKRISSLHESSHSTRTKRVSRMAVIQSVSKLSDAHLHKESMYCRSYVELKGRWEHEGISCFLPWSLPVVFARSLSVALQVPFFLLWCQSVLEKRNNCSLSCSFISTRWFHTTQFFLFRDHVVQALQICGLSCCLSPPAGASVFVQRQTWGPKLYLEYSAYVLAMFLPPFLCSGALWMTIRTSWG